jgi:hypothetical protein
MLIRHESCGMVCAVATSFSTEYGMKISIILAHPEKQSFNHGIAKTDMARLRQNWHTSYFHDLYHENFNPMLPTREIPKDATTGHDLIPLPGGGICGRYNHCASELVGAVSGHHERLDRPGTETGCGL